MNGVWPQVALVVVLVLVNAAFAGSEVALITLREGQLQRLDQQGGRGRLVARLARDPNQFLSTIQIGITLAGFLASAAARRRAGRAAGAAARRPRRGGRAGGDRGGHRRPDLRHVGRRRAGPQAGRAATPRAVGHRRRPPADAGPGGDPSVQREAVTEDEVRDLVATQAAFDPEHRTLLLGAFEIAERRLRDVLVDRTSTRLNSSHEWISYAVFCL